MKRTVRAARILAHWNIPCSTFSCSPSPPACLPPASATPMPANGCEEETMIFDYSLAGLVSLGLLFYLTYALLRPERF
jgi:K+-transporting ATPase KdpF subunit